MTESDATILATTLFTRWRPSLVRYVLQASVSTTFQIRAYDPEFESQMASAREVMREQRDVLAELDD